MSSVEDLAIEVLNVRNQTVGEVWEDGPASKRSECRIFSVVKRIHCSIVRSVVDYYVSLKHSSFQNENIGSLRI